MNIVVIAPASVNHTVKVVNALYERNHSLHLFSLKNHKQGKDKLINGVNVYYSPNRSPFGYYIDFKWVRCQIEKIKPDIINVHYATGYGTIARLCGILPALLSVWGSDVFDFPKKNLINRILLRKNLAFFNHIVSTSEVMALETKKYLHTTPEISVIPFGVNLDKFKPVKKINCDSTEVKIICIKNLEPVYGIDFLIEGLKILPSFVQNKNLNISLDIYGSGSQNEQLQNLINKNNLSDSIKLKGYIENSKVPRVLADSDICCIPSLRESFGVSVLEAMAMNIPVLATETDGFKEIIDNNYDGILVQPANSRLIAEKLALLIDNTEIRKHLVLNARKKVEKFYDWNTNMDSFEELLVKVKHS